MKKIIVIFAFIVAALAAQAQSTYTLCAGAKGVDSITGAHTTYYYLMGTSGTQNSVVTPHGTAPTTPVKYSQVCALMIGTVHSAVTGSGDSTLFTVEVSVDGTNWFQWNITPDVVVQTGTSKITLATSTYATLALTSYGLYKPTTGNVWPYLRVKAVHSATGAKYPKIYAILKPL